MTRARRAAGRRYLLLVLLHSAGDSADSVVTDLHLEAAAGRRIIVARPDAVVGQGGGSYWNATGNGRYPYDEIFLQAMVGHNPDLTDAFAPAALDWFAAHPRR